MDTTDTTLHELQERIDRQAETGDDEQLARTIGDALVEVATTDRATRDRLDEWVARLRTLHEERRELAVARHYARGLAAVAADLAEREALTELPEFVGALRDVHEQHQDEEIAVNLADALVDEARANETADGGDPDEIHANLQFVDNLSRQYPGRRLAERLAAALGHATRASYDAGDDDDVRRKAGRIDGLYQQYPTDEMARLRVKGTHPRAWVHGRNEAFDDLADEIETAEQLAAEHDHDEFPELLAWHYRNAVYVRFDADGPEAATRALDRLAAFYRDNPEDDVASMYAGGLRRGTEYALNGGNREAAATRLDRLEELVSTHGESAAGSLAAALEAAATTRADAGETETAQRRFQRLRDLVDTYPEAAAEPFGEAVERRVTAALSEDDVERAESLTAEFEAVATTPAERRQWAELSFRTNLARGRWFGDAGYDVTVLSEGDGTATLAVDDTYGITHHVEVEPGGYVRTVTGAGDIPGDWDALSPLQQVLARPARGYAADWADDTLDGDYVDPHQDRTVVEEVYRAVADCSTERVVALFGRLGDQLASHFGADTPFVDGVERPVTVPGVDLDDGEVRYGQWVGVVDGAVETLSDIEVARIENGDREVVREVPEPDAPTRAYLSLPPRPLFSDTQLRDGIVTHLACLVRDWAISGGVEPPAELRMLGPGRYSMTKTYRYNDGLPALHEPGATVPEYEQTPTDETLRAEQMRRAAETRFDERSRAIADAYRSAPAVREPAPVTTNPERTGMEE